MHLFLAAQIKRFLYQKLYATKKISQYAMRRILAILDSIKINLCISDYINEYEESIDIALQFLMLSIVENSAYRTLFKSLNEEEISEITEISEISEISKI